MSPSSSRNAAAPSNGRCSRVLPPRDPDHDTDRVRLACVVLHLTEPFDEDSDLEMEDDRGGATIERRSWRRRLKLVCHRSMPATDVSSPFTSSNDRPALLTPNAIILYIFAVILLSPEFLIRLSK
ncbi:hypothetical protein V1515DRAFT_580834 [Lipomyces mesembrius]